MVAHRFVEATGEEGSVDNVRRVNSRSSKAAAASGGCAGRTGIRSSQARAGSPGSRRRACGEPHHQFSRGPDGKRYATGEVVIDMGTIPGDPAATIAKMQQVRAAALAPDEPSSQDMRWPVPPLARRHRPQGSDDPQAGNHRPARCLYGQSKPGDCQALSASGEASLPHSLSQDV